MIEKHNIKTKKVEVLGAIGLNLDEYSYSKQSLEKITSGAGEEEAATTGSEKEAINELAQ